MLNIRKRFFLLLTIIGLVLGLTACVSTDEVVRLSFDNSEYTLRVGQELDITPIIEKGSKVGTITVEYSSIDPEVATFVNGKLTGVQPGETEIKIVCSEKRVAFDVAKVVVVENELPIIDFVQPQASMVKGTTQTLQYSFVPEYASANLAFASANPEVATINEDGEITACGVGTAVIMVRATDVKDENSYRDYNFVIEVIEADFLVHYVLNGGENNPENPAGYNVLTLPIELKAPTREAYRFLGWYLVEDGVATETMLTEIAAGTRGDVTVEAKWELVVYSVEYDLDGGENAASNPATYNIENTPVTLAEPTKRGYAFKGWEHEGEIVTEIPAGQVGDFAVKATWELVEYTISYDLAGGAWQNLNGVVWPYGRDRNAMVRDFVVDFNAFSKKTVAADGSDFFARSYMGDGSSLGYNFLTSDDYSSKWGWMLDYINAQRVARGVEPMKSTDGQAEARGEINNFLNKTDKKDSAGYGSDYSSEEVANGFWISMLDLPEVVVVNSFNVLSDAVAIPTPIYKLGYEFLGWYNGENKVDEIPAGSVGNIDLVAKWQIETYEINYQLNGGIFDLYKYASREAMVDDFLNDAMAFYNVTKKPVCMVDDSGAKVGFANAFSAIYSLFNDATYGAKWSWLKNYIIDSTENTSTKSSLQSGSEAFWRYSIGAFLFKEVRASWPKSEDFTVEAKNNGFWNLIKKEGAVEPVSTYTVNDMIVLPTPTQGNQVFLGWFLNGEKVTSINAGTTGTINLVAKWYNPDQVLVINFELNGGSLPEEAVKQFVAKDGLAAISDAIKAGYTFAGWFKDAACTEAVTSFEAGLLENPTIYAKWTLNTYTIEYETNGGEFQVDKTVSLYDSFEDLVNAFINDYAEFYNISGLTAQTFFGKTNQFGPYGFFSNAEMGAKWNWLVSYLHQVASENNYAGKTNLLLAAGAANFNKYVRTNLAAFLQQARLTNISPLPMNFTEADCEALWTACPTKEIKVGIKAKYEYTVEELPLELASPFKEGATFVGWYLNENIKDGKVDTLTIEHLGNVKLYARWSDSEIEFDTYDITYNLDGGTLPSEAPKTYVEEVGATLVDPTKVGYTFEGWFLNEECTEAVTEFTALDKGDKVVFAKWTAITYKVVFNAGEGQMPVEQIQVGKYADYIDWVKEFVVDFNAFSKKTVAADGSDFFQRSYMGDGSSLGYNFLTSADYSAKWGWMLTLINEQRLARGAAEMKATDGQAEARGEINNLLNKTNSSASSGFGSDYSSAAVYEKVWDHIEKIHFVDKVIDLQFTVEDLPVELPKPVAPADQKFAGWYANAEFTGSTIAILPVGTIGDQTVFAKYVDASEELKGNITYVLNDGTLSEGAPVEFVVGTEFALTATATKTGYTFKGWFTDSEFNNEITAISADYVGDIQLFAKFEINKYEIVFENSEVETQTLEHGSALPTPEQVGYVFNGWFDNSELSGTAITTATKAGTVYASWTIITYQVEFVPGEGTMPTEQVEIVIYPEYVDWVKEFVVDFNAFSKKTVAADGSDFFKRSWMADGSSLGYNFLTSDDYSAKWGWMLTLINTQRVARGAAEMSASDGQAEARGEIHNLLNKTDSSASSGFGSDYSTPAVYELVWNYIEKSRFEERVVNFQYTVETLPAILPVPGCPEGKAFVGWFDNEELTGEAITTIAANTTGNMKLYAKFDIAGYDVTFINGGNLTSENIKHGEKLPTPTLAGKEFKGWFLNEECTQAAPETVTSEMTVYGLWGLLTFDAATVEISITENLDAALSAAPENSVIRLAAGDYTLGTAITKSVRIIGADKATTTIKVTAGITNLKAEFIQIENVKFTGDGKNVGGIYFQPGTKARNVVFNNCIVDAVNTFYKSATEVNTSVDLSMDSCEFIGVGQFIVWVTKSFNSLTVTNSVIDAANCGTITNAAGTLFRMRIGSAKFVGNTFIGDCPSNGGIFESGESCTQIELFANKFVDTTKPIRLAGGKPVIFNNNLYMSSDEALTACPFSGAGVTADTTVCANEEELATAAEALAMNKTVTFDTKGGAIQSDYADFETFTVAGLLPVAKLYDHYFLGWCTDEECATTPTMIARTAGTYYAKFQQIPVNTINYELNGGTLGANSPVEWKEGTSVELVPATKENATFIGWYNNAEFTGSAITTIPATQKGNITLYARFENWVFKTINYNLDGGTLPEGAATQYPVTQGLAELPTPTKENFKFLGWFNNPEHTGEAVTSIASTDTEEVTLYALWLDLSVSYEITYVLNGGNTLYATREALVADLLADLNTVTNTSIDKSNFRSKCRQNQFSLFIADDDMWAKWSWLFTFLKEMDKNANSHNIYDEVLATRTCASEFWWFLTRDFDGFVNKNVGNFYYSVAPINFNTYEAGDGFWDLLQTQFVDANATELLTPNRPYYVFEGWYENAELTGERVLVPTSNQTLYAKWSKQTVTLTYHLNNEDATVTESVKHVHASDEFALETPSYNPTYYKFNGWYTDETLVTPISEVKQYTNSDIDAYASWTEIDGYTITYNLNGGSLIYQDRDAVLADLLADYNSATGKTYASPEEVPTGAWADIDYHTFYFSVLSNGTVIANKWRWLVQYMYTLSKRDLASNNCNVLGLKSLIDGNAPSGDSVYGVSYAFRAFISGSTVRPDSAYTSVNYTVYENAHGFWDVLSAAENTEYLNNKGTTVLPTAYLENYKFVGWYDNAECIGNVITEVTDAATLYAKYVEQTPVESVTIDNKVAEMTRYSTHQLTWTVAPANANIQAVKFSSTDNNVATVDVNGLVTAVDNGTCVIKCLSLSPSGKYDEMTVTVYTPDHFQMSYETNSYVAISETIKLNAELVKRDGSTVAVTWSSLNPEIATVDANGNVTGVAEGLATIRASISETVYQDMIVTVLPASLSAELQEVVDAHESNTFNRWELGIGAGTPAYYRDIYGSVSKLLYQDFEKKLDYKAAQDAKSGNHGGLMSSIEFVTVHYTGNMGSKSTASANANYFVNQSPNTSIHYVTGNDGVYYCLDEKYVGFHAGDGTSATFRWFATGVMYTEGTEKTPVWGINSQSKFTINGVDTVIDVPQGDTSATAKVTGNTFIYNGVEQNCINDMGLAWKIVDGQYYMGTTYWQYNQIAAGRICSHGGNNNSVGIESAVNPESDLWLTWQMTAQLVADILIRNNLDISRVVGHHFFSAKDCPQPLLENDLEIWKEFIELVKHEYKVMTEFADVDFQFSTTSDILADNGRISEQPLHAEIATYTVTVNGQSITLATMVEGRYNKCC